MEDFDGKTWKVHPYRLKMREFQLQSKQQFKPTLTGPSLSYEVIAEPSFQPWLFAINIAVPADTRSSINIIQSSDFLLYSRLPVLTKYPYAINSYPEALASQMLTKVDIQINLTLPQKVITKKIDN
jgi:hypothetical protein